MRRDISFCAKSVRYNTFTNGAPYLDSFHCLTDPRDLEILSTRFNTQSSLLM